MNRRRWSVLVVSVAVLALVVALVLRARDDGAPVSAQPAAPVFQNIQAQVAVTGQATVLVGRPVELVGFAIGSSAKPAEKSFDFGDGSTISTSDTCRPGRPASPKTGTLEVKRSHTYTKTGTFTVRFSVDGGCTGYSGSATAVTTVKVVSRL